MRSRFRSRISSLGLLDCVVSSGKDRRFENVDVVREQRNLAMRIREMSHDGDIGYYDEYMRHLWELNTIVMNDG